MDRKNRIDSNNTGISANSAGTSEIPLKNEEFAFFCDFIFKLSGILIDSSKKVMVQNRLYKRLRELRLSSYAAYAEFVKKNSEEHRHFINALTTNKTNFFRESQHFDFLKNVYFKEYLATHRAENKATLYAWSAACSAGQEVYTLAMIYNEFIQHNPGPDYRILGTDIDTSMLDIADKGIYPLDIKAEIPPNYFLSSVEKVRPEGSNDYSYQISTALKEKVKFRQFNLINDQERVTIHFDIIFLLNVLIYFPREVIVRVITKLVSHLNIGGYLFIGHSESIADISEHLKSVAPAVYKKVR